MRLALLSDIHGNLTGLEAVLEHIHTLGADGIYALGDFTGGGSAAGEIFDVLLEHGARLVRGNWEEMLYDAAAHAHKAQDPQLIIRTVEWVRARLTPAHWDLIARMPLGLTVEPAPGRRVFLCHAAPGDTWSLSCRPDAPVDLLRRLYSPVDAEIVVYGHYHSHHVLALDGKLLVNVASVGLRRDGLSAVTLLDYVAGPARDGGWAIQQLQVPYDVEKEERRKREREAPG